MTRKWILLTAVGMLALTGVAFGVAFGIWRGSPEKYTVGRALTPEEVEAGVPLESQSFDTFEAAMASIGADPDDFRVPQQTGDHCVVSISPVQPGERSSVVSAPQCYSTFSEAQDAANGVGTMSSRTVIGIDYEDAKYGGLSLTWTADNSVGCDTGLSYAAASMPSAGWNDRVSSAKTYGGCGTNTHYQDSNYVGSQHVCECATMHAMNDHTSSDRWAP